MTVQGMARSGSTRKRERRVGSVEELTIGVVRALAACGWAVAISRWFFDKPFLEEGDVSGEGGMDQYLIWVT